MPDMTNDNHEGPDDEDAKEPASPRGTTRGSRVPRPMWEKALQIYLDGERNVTRLARIMDMSRQTVSNMVNHGYPKQGWPSFVERAKLHDQRKIHEDAKAQAQSAQMTVDRIQRARDERMQILRVAKGGYARLWQKWTDAAGRASFDGRGAKVVDATGLEKPAVGAGALASKGFELMRGWEIFTRLEEDALIEGGKASADDFDLADAGIPPGLGRLTPDDLAYIQKHGRLPAHVSDEDIFGTGDR